MFKKPSKINLFPNYIYLVFFMTVTFVAGGLGGYYWQTEDGATRCHDLVSEVNRLYSQFINQKLSQNQFSGSFNLQNNELRGSAEEAVHEDAVKTETRFNVCRHITHFKYQKWYKDLINESESYGVDISKSTSACLSEDTGLLVYLVPAKEACQPADIYHYDVNKNQLLKARYLKGAEGCLGELKQFWYRDGNIINLVGYRKQDNCELFDYFGYDYLKNSFELTKRIRNCK